MTLKSVNPATNEVIGNYEEMTHREVSDVLKNVHMTFTEWKYSSFAQRKELMKNAADILRKRKKEFGKIMSLEMGKPFPQAIAEAEKCATVCDYYGENAESILVRWSIAM